MKTISNIEELKNAIRLEEVKHSINKKLLKEQLLMIFEILKPGNILIDKIKEVATGRNLVRLVAGTAVGLITGNLSRKIVIGTSAIVLRKIFELILQYGSARFFSKNGNIVDFFSNSSQQQLSKRDTP